MMADSLSRRIGGMAVAIIAITALTATPAPASTVSVDLGGLVLDVSDSWTAQVFHIVDQLSGWDEFAHKQYRTWAERELSLTPTDRELLQRHAGLRRARGRGNGFEQAFLVDLDLAQAAAAAIGRRDLSADEATAEQGILQHFSERLSSIRGAGDRNIASFRERLISEGQRLQPFTQKLLHFAEAPKPPRLLVFLVTNPEERSGGGGGDGGRLVVEVQRAPDPLTFVIHESLHALLAPHEAAIARAAESVGLTSEALNEGVVYAMAPGLTDDGSETDTLFDQLARFLAAGRPATDSYARFYTIAGLIRPLLRTGLDRGETITTFLPRAAARWRSFTGR